MAGPVIAQEKQINLSLKDALSSGLKSNLDVAVEFYNPAIAEADLRRSKGIYDTHLLLSTSYLDSTTLPVSTLTGGGVSTSEQQIFKYSVGANQLIPTGATLGIAFNNSWNKNNFDASRGFINDYWQSDLTLSLTQPLLKNFGKESTELAIKVAAYGKEGSIERLRSKLLDIIAQIRNEYFKLYSLREDLKVKDTSLALARKILDETKARVKAGVLPAMEILNAEFGVASREKDMIDAERAVRDQADVLRKLVTINEAGELIPIDLPEKEPVTPDEATAITKALTSRPDLVEQRVNQRTLELQEKVTRNQTRPDLNLSAAVGLNGLGQAYSRDLERVGSTNYPVWTIGLTLDYPLGNSVAENDYIKSRLKSAQNRTQIKSSEENVANEVRSAVRGVITGYKQIDVAGRGRIFAEERLKSFIKKNEVGLATTKDVLDVENDLVNAKSNQIKADVGYATALTLYWKATGELLEREGVVVESRKADELYERSSKE
jgi:outer membrane protein TolC